MKLTIKHCNNIDEGSIDVEENTLNIKYAMNGTGKSTIARAIELHLRDDGSMAELTPFKVLESGETDAQPQITGLDGVSSVAIFNDEYIDQFAFQQDEILQDSFGIFIKTPDYDAHIAEIDKITTEITNTFRDSTEIDKVIGDLATLSESFGKSKKGYSAASALAKGIGKGNKVANIPKGLESYTAYLKSSLNAKWLKWQMDGNTYVDVSDNCPYCTSPTSDKKDTIAQVSKEYDAKSVEHLNRIVSVLESLGQYFSQDANDRLQEITRNVDGFSTEQMNYLLQIKGQVDTLQQKLLELRGITYYSMKDADKVSDLLAGQKIDLSYLSEMDSESTRELVEKINGSLDVVLAKVGNLQGEVAKQTALIKKTIEENKAGINNFLKFAGYKYCVDAEYVKESYRMRLRHVDSSKAVPSGTQHLSYGEKNAFALVLFMYECLAKQADVIILDDPISSFDRDKKYAVIDMLFRGKKSLRGKTVLMMTHDLEPIIDILYNLPHKFNSAPRASYLELRSGTILEKPITREDLSTFATICDDNIGERDEDVVKLVYLRRHYEVLNNRGVSYQLLSNLLHKRDKPYKKESGKETPLMPEEIDEATREIQSKMPSFDYARLLKKVSDVESMKEAFAAATYNYEKLQIFRVLQDRFSESDVIHKFINETFHIENEYIMQLNPCKYEMVPEFIVEECERIVSSL